MKFFKLLFGSRLINARKKNPLPEKTTPLIGVKTLEVIDGDTVLVTDSENKILRLRLSSIDCPEDDQPWGDIAKAGLIKMIGGRSIQIETHGVDPHGRTVATIYVHRDSKVINVNERMVMLGHAWVYRRFYGHLPKARQVKLNKLESWAKLKRVGLWQTDRPIAPWRWRFEQARNSYYAVIFTSRKKLETPGYSEMAYRMEAFASRQDGYIGMQSARDEDGFGVTVSYWETLEAVAKWKKQEEHLEAQQKGRGDWYLGYEVRVCKVERSYSFGEL